MFRRNGGILTTHKRKCWDCNTVNEHRSDVVPGVLCPRCGSQDTRKLRVTQIEDVRPFDKTQSRPMTEPAKTPIKRYDIWVDETDSLVETQSDDGEWCDFDDVAPLLQRIEELVELCEEAAVKFERIKYDVRRIIDDAAIDPMMSTVGRRRLDDVLAVIER